MIDPPSGWKYGFPKAMPVDEKDLMKWIVDNGYPQEEIDKLGDAFYYSKWYKADKQQ